MNSATAQIGARNHYPLNFRLPGEKTPGRMKLPAIEGTARRCIVHALTWHGIPRWIDNEIAKLPSEKEILALNPLSRKYLAFSVYSLKQMVAAGTIKPETAWTLFGMEWTGVKQEPIFHKSFVQRRADFFSSLQASLDKKEAPPDLLEFEFWARAGKAGLEQFQRYFQWAEKLIFIRKGFRRLGEGIKEEYRKALWLEMRLGEDQLGSRGLNKDIGRMILLKDGAYFFKRRRTIGMTISLRSEEGLDSTIKAEMGHWLFELLAFKAPWVEELMDRMNMAGYTRKANRKSFSPESRTWREGGYYLAARKVMLDDAEASYQTYPDEFPAERMKAKERHEVAELVERFIRFYVNQAVEKKLIAKSEAYNTYRKIGLYIALLKLEGKTKVEILKKVSELNTKEINRYARDWKQKAVPALEKALNHPSLHIRGMAAKALIHFRNRPKNSPAFRQLYAYQLIDQGSYEKLFRLGKDAIPALEALKKSHFQELVKRAEAMIEEINKQK